MPTDRLVARHPSGRSTRACCLLLGLTAALPSSCTPEDAGQHQTAEPDWRATLRSSDWGKPEFTECYAAAAREILSASPEIPEAMTVKVRVGEEVYMAYLENAWNEARRAEADPISVIERYMETLAQANRNLAQALDPDTLIIVVRDRSYIESLEQLEGADPPVSRKLVGGLYEVVVVNTPKMVRMTYESELQSAGLTTARAFDRARKNLAATATDLKVLGDNAVKMIVVGDYLESGILVLPDVWDRLSGTVEGELVAAVPARDLVFFTGTEEKGGVAELQRAVERVMNEVDHLVSPKLLVWRNGRWITR